MIKFMKNLIKILSLLIIAVIFLSVFMIFGLAIRGIHFLLTSNMEKEKKISIVVLLIAISMISMAIVYSAENRGGKSEIPQVPGNRYSVVYSIDGDTGTPV